MKRRSLFLTFVLALISTGSALAEQTLSGYFSVELAPRFTPLDGFYLLESGPGKVVRLQALLRPVEADLGTGQQGGYLLAASLPTLPMGANSKITAVLLGGNENEFLVVPGIELPVAEVGEMGSVELVSEHLNDRKVKLKEVQEEAKAEAGTLARLKADAVIIADIEKIRVLKEEIEATDESIARLDSDILTLQESVKEAKKRPAPKNHATREAELTKQVAELASLAKAAERGEDNRGTAAELNLQSKQALIESTRFDDVYTLQRTLDRLNESIKQLQTQ